MTHPIKTPKKLIETSLPLDAINEACAYEKMPGIGPHPRGIHMWWARRPLAAARAVIFAQMVNDPGYERHLGRGMNKQKAQLERERLFGILRRLVQWENTNNEAVLAEARAEIWASWRETCSLNKSHPQAAELFNPEKLPAFHDPFAGGGALPLEAQRLGLESHASDLNPVAVLINKAMIEIPPKFAGRAPVGPRLAEDKQVKLNEDWSGAKGLAEDVRRYGAWMREEAIKRIGHLYPQVDLPAEHGGGKATVIAWLWARTVKSPNPAYSHIEVPLASTFILSSKAGKEAYVQPVLEGGSYRFEVRNGKPPESAKNGTKLARGANFSCLMSDTPIDPKYIYAAGKAGEMGYRLMAIVAEGKSGRLYLPPTDEMEAIARQAKPTWKPETAMPANPRWFSPPAYGMDSYGDLFTPRQLVALTTFSDLVAEVRAQVKADSLKAGLSDDGCGLDAGGTGATAYADAVATYLTFAVDRCADFSNSTTRWVAGNQKVMNLFGKQAIAMTWDYPEANILADTVGGFKPVSDFIADCINKLPNSRVGGELGVVHQFDAQTQAISTNKVVSTDPPYYDNIGYADLSDFFYVWLRRSLRPIYPGLFSTMAVPKAEELVATPYRHGSKEKAEQFFLEGMTAAMHRLAEQAHPCFPVTIYYAFKASETTEVGTGNTGWETFLEAVLRAGFAITGTWPMRSEQAHRMVGIGTNALASSIVLVCQKRASNAPSISLREFVKELRAGLTEAMEVMIGGAEGISPVAPVDLAQAIIGPGMAVFSRYAEVLKADGSAMSVHEALLQINKVLTEGGDDFDADSQFCLAWFDTQGWSVGEFGTADVLARAKGTSVAGVAEAGVIESGGGKVRLMKADEYPADWDPSADKRLPIWEACHHLIRLLSRQGETEAGRLLARIHDKAEPIRALAYRLYTLCERKGWAEEARAYNELITSWPAIVAASHEVGHVGAQQTLGLDF